MYRTRGNVQTHLQVVKEINNNKGIKHKPGVKDKSPLALQRTTAQALFQKQLYSTMVHRNTKHEDYITLKKHKNARL